MNAIGPISEQLLAILAEVQIFCDYRDGKITREEYVAALEAQADELEEKLGGARNLRLLASRYPRDMVDHTLEMFGDLRAQGFVEGEPDEAALREFRERVGKQYDHSEKRTYIQPNEAGLVCLVSLATQPRHMVTIGSYYGYWAIWAMPGVMAGDGDATLIDPNPSVCELAERNFAAFGFGDRTSVLNAKAQDVMDELPDDIDLVLLDADGGREHPDPAYHGKGIYAIFAKLILPKMVDGGLLLVHNDYRLPVGVNPLSQSYIEQSAKQLTRFHEFCDAHFREGIVLDTPDGLGVYLK